MEQALGIRYWLKEKGHSKWVAEVSILLLSSSLLSFSWPQWKSLCCHALCAWCPTLTQIKSYGPVTIDWELCSMKQYQLLSVKKFFRYIVTEIKRWLREIGIQIDNLPPEMEKIIGDISWDHRILILKGYATFKMFLIYLLILYVWMLCLCVCNYTWWSWSQKQSVAPVELQFQGWHLRAIV